MKKTLIITLLGLAVVLASFTVIKTGEPKSDDQGIKWVTFQEAIELSKKKPKKIFVDVYTDWCGYCKKMDKATFQNKEVGEYMNKNFYCVKFNAETKEEYTFGDKTYVNNGRNHQLARELLNGKMSFPTVVFLDERFSNLSPVPGYQEPTQFLHIARFFGDDEYKTKNWAEYNGETTGGTDNQ